MKQLVLFNTQDEQPVQYWELFVDGASRGNPGLGGAGICLFKDSVLHYAQGFFLGHCTNNQAEYTALLIGLFITKKYLKDNNHILIISDSELLIKQMQGLYSVKNTFLKKLFLLAKKLLDELETPYSFKHILRDKNTHADEMANKGIDKQIAMPAGFIKHLQHHDITF